MGEKLNKRMKGLQYAGREVRIGIYGVCKKKGNRRMRGFEHAGWGGKKKREKLENERIRQKCMILKDGEIAK